MALPYEQLQCYSKYSRILLLYSGGLDTSFLLRYFTRELKGEVVTVSFDLGGDQRERSLVEQRAYRLGSSRHIHIEAIEEFLTEYCFRAVKANCQYEGAHPLSSSLSRPLMAKHAVELAHQYGCVAIMHGSNGWQNNSARFDTSIRALASDVEIVEPVMELNISRGDAYTYLCSQGLDIEKREDNLLSSDNNLWGREIEDGILDHPDIEPAADIYRLTVDPILAPDQPTYLTVTFDHGIPTELNDVPCTSVALVETLNKIGGKCGVGRHDAYEDKVLGHKVREIHESPAATILIIAHRDLQTFITSKRTLPVKQSMDTLWTELACFGLWYHPLRTAVEAFIDQVNKDITGTVRLKLFKGHCSVVGRTSANGLVWDKIPSKLVGARHPDRNYYDFTAFETVVAYKKNK